MRDYDKRLVSLLTDTRTSGEAVERAQERLADAGHELVDAKDSRARTFGRVGQRLADLWESGDYSASDILYIQSHMILEDPLTHSYGGLDPDELVSRFEMLSPGQYVLGLSPHGERRVTGRITDTVRDFEVIPEKIYPRGSMVMQTSLAPSIRFNVPITRTELPEIFQISHYGLRFGAIGREAIEKAAHVAKFDRISYGTDQFDNSLTLEELRTHIYKLYDLGMEEVDLSPLDEEIEKAHQVAAAETR